MDRFAFEAEVLTRDLWSLSVRVAGTISLETEDERGSFIVAAVEHVESLEDVRDSDEWLLRKGDDVTTLLDPRELPRLEREAEHRYERERMGPLVWQYARAM